MSTFPELNLLILHQYPILDQLYLEEALLRAHGGNWFLMNQNPSDAIVMGISALPETVIDFIKWQQKPVPVIRRFSGGGTVFIDENSLMATFICNQADTGVVCFPQPVLQWSKAFYQPVFQDLEFRLHENDYVLGHKKFGGNAQYMMRNRWLHHTSFLWDYNEEKMNYLKMPPKMPVYRQNRSHGEFLCKLKEHFSHPREFLERVVKNLERHFFVKQNQLTEVQAILHLPHRRASKEYKKGC